MEDILIIKDGADYAEDASANAITNIGGVTYDIHDLEDGGILAFDDTGAVISPTAPAISGNNITFALGRTTEGTKVGLQMERATLSVNKKVYVAPVAKVMCLGDDGTNSGLTDIATDILTAMVEGDVLGVHVTDGEEPYFAGIDGTKLFAITLSAADAASTVLVVLTKLISSINSDTSWNQDEDGNNIVTAALVNTDEGISFTGRVGKKFNIAPFGELEDVTVSESSAADGSVGWIDNTTYSTLTSPTLNTMLITGATFNVTNVVPLVLGWGTSDQISDLEEYCSTFDGNTDKNSKHTMWDVTARTVSGETYTTYTFQWTTTNNSPTPQPNSDVKTFNLAVPSTYAAMVAYLDTIVAAI